MKIQDTTPTATTLTFDGAWWVTLLNIAFPTPVKHTGSLVVTLLPHDGGAHLLATGGKNVQVPNITAARATDPTLGTVLDGLQTELQRLSSKPAPAAPNTLALLYLVVQAPDPTKPAIARATFSDKSVYTIPDILAMVGTDAAFAAAFAATLAKVAALAGKTVA